MRLGSGSNDLSMMICMSTQRSTSFNFERFTIFTNPLFITILTYERNQNGTRSCIKMNYLPWEPGTLIMESSRKKFWTDLYGFKRSMIIWELVFAGVVVVSCTRTRLPVRSTNGCVVRFVTHVSRLNSLSRNQLVLVTLNPSRS